MERLVTIITATTGKHYLKRCIDSVKAQTYKPIQHLVVVDGKDNWDAADEILQGYSDVDVIHLPYPTRQWGGRIYAAMPVLSRGDFIENLDDDNFIDPHHVESLAHLLITNGIAWAHCLRKLTSREITLDSDNCESLGLLHAVWDRPMENLIDTNCFFFTRKVAVELGHFWAPLIFESQDYFNDRRFLKELLDRYPTHQCTFGYTLNYEVPPEKRQYFERGNLWMREKFGATMPWE